MDPPERLAILHQPTRLRIMAHLARHRDAGFGPLRDALGLTDGNLGSHAAKLEDVGLITSRRALGVTGVMVRYTITPEGDRALVDYARWLRRVLAGDPGSAAPAGRDDRRGQQRGDEDPRG